ncbi:hypothetical protein Sjap_020281 [Stephania japonica]|uniref:NmrA-like domain-containing protein n=1 Tax=Stephania japonica TaxID=461633 RepID=A0AAP0F361_9MAGN
MASEKSRVLVFGGTGYLGKRLVKASLREGHPTYVLQRPENCMDINKIQLLLRLKKRGAKLIKGSVSDHESLVHAVKQVDIVISALSSSNTSMVATQLQQKIIDAIKEAGNVKRFIPAEFCIDPATMVHDLEPARSLNLRMMDVRKAIVNAKIPYTSIAANCFAGYFVPNLCQLGTLLPPKDKVSIFGDGNAKAIYLDEDDIATYTIKTIDDPRTINKTLHLMPPNNTLSQNELVNTWEKLFGKKLEKITISAESYLATMKGAHHLIQFGISHNYPIFYKGYLRSIELKEGDEEATMLYPDVKYTTVEEYLKRFADMRPREAWEGRKEVSKL